MPYCVLPACQNQGYFIPCSAVEDIRLRLSIESESNPKFKTQLLVFPQRNSQGTSWSEPKSHKELFLKQNTIPPQTAALLLGVLDEIPFKTSSVISISGVVLCRTKCSPVNIQNLLDYNIQFSAEELVLGVLETFSKSDPEDDDRSLFSVVVSSPCYQLKVGTSLPVPTCLRLPSLGLRPLCASSRASADGPGFWVGSASGGLKGLVVACHPLSNSQYRLDVYAKDVKQVLLLVHGLGSHLGVEEWRPECKTNASECAHSLFDEMRLLLSAAQFPIPEFTPEAWAEFKQKLSILELKTDLDFQSFYRNS